MKKLARNLAVIALSGTLCAVVGCGGGAEIPRHPVSGTVSVGGEPLSSGVIRFIPVAMSDAPATQAAIAQGQYSVPEEEGLPPGVYRVEIEANHLGFALDDEKAYVEEIEKKRGGVRPPNPIAPRYNSNSELKVNIVAGDDQKFDFQLEPARS